MYMWSLKNKPTNVLQDRNRLTVIESKLVISSGEREGKKSTVGLEDYEIQTTWCKINKQQ